MATPATPQQQQHHHHHTRAPRTPESYFNVPESIALLNIVKSERIQTAFQSNRKNHASVWEMVADVLNRFSTRKRSAKQCCNRYENLKKIYTQLKKNPEKHVRRNWPYMYLFREIEEQRGECWGSNGKRPNGLKSNGELSYYHRRRAAALSLLMNKDTLSMAMGNGGNEHLERFVANNFVEAELNEFKGSYRDEKDDEEGDDDSISFEETKIPSAGATNMKIDADGGAQFHDKMNSAAAAAAGFMNLKYETPSDHEFSDINLMPTNYNGNHNYYPNNLEPNILHPDVIVDTDNASQSSCASVNSKRKHSTSTDGGESTNYELIEYLKRREKRDEEMLKRMDEREERLLKLLERSVVAFECLASNTNGNNAASSHTSPLSAKSIFHKN